VWRTLDEVTPGALRRVEKVRAKVRCHVWSQMSRLPTSKVAGMDLRKTIVLDADSTLVTAHSEKEQAAATFKHGFGFHPIGVWCDNTHEWLAVTLRPGNAGSNHAGDHIEVLSRSIAQIPARHRRQLLIRADRAGATHQLLNWLTALGQVRGRRVEYSVGFSHQERGGDQRYQSAPGDGVDARGDRGRSCAGARRRRRDHRVARPI